MQKNNAFCSICTVNYSAYAGTLSDSLKSAGHNEPHYVLIVDYDEKYKVIIERFKFTPVYLHELQIPKIDELIKKYSAFELSNVLKPFFMEWLLKDHKEINNLVYLDTDIYVYSQLNEVFDYLNKNKQVSVILTAHFGDYESYAELSGYKFEKTIFAYGLYNGGFFTLKNDQNSLQFLGWLKNKLFDYCYDALNEYMFVDQKILDFAPILFEFVGVYKNKTYNVAYWNYPSNLIREEQEVYYVGKEKLVFFHFSQLKPDAQDITINFYRDISSENRQIFGKMASDYWLCLKKNGYEEIKNIPYKYGDLYTPPSWLSTDSILSKSKELASTLIDLNTTKLQLKSIGTELDLNQVRLGLAVEELGITKSNLDSIKTQLKSKVAELSEIYACRGWRMIVVLRNVLEYFLPNGSRRRKVVAILFRISKRIVKYVLELERPLSHVTVLINKALYVYKRDGFRNMLRRSKRYITYRINLRRSYKTKPEIYNTDYIDVLDIKTIKEIDFADVRAPKVSIIISVFNKWKYTYNCLKSLKENLADISFEVVIVDDGSTDETKKMVEKIKNAVYIKNKKNYGFVGSCNSGAKRARGEYLVFLNNDTIVKKNWLNALLDTFQSNKNIGLAGSKLIYPDGRLQEAGGIVWKNGNACNYGRYGNPNDPEFNYLKDVDYCSGASIMLRKNVFEKLGGFDEIFSPGYYEDTDLAFKVRRLGLRTVYQPKSGLFHFEGITSGNDLKSGIKKYQEINSKKFFKRWHEVLEKENFDDSECNIFLARDRSKNRKTVLFMDNNVPTFDKDAGSFIAFQYLRILNDLNYKVIFWPHNLEY
ncbi:MAG: glycosyltransferase family 2 protein, partial [Candidatus Taylorbacteria bacterium]